MVGLVAVGFAERELRENTSRESVSQSVSHGISARECRFTSLEIATTQNRQMYPFARRHPAAAFHPHHPSTTRGQRKFARGPSEPGVTTVRASAAA